MQICKYTKYRNKEMTAISDTAAFRFFCPVPEVPDTGKG